VLTTEYSAACRRWIACALFLIAWDCSCGSSCAVADALPISPGSWSLAIFPDTQGYAKDFPQIYDAETQFVRDHATSLNIKYVLHEGDITNDNVPEQWDNALHSMNILNGVVPYALVTGNHDVGPGGNGNSRDSYFNDPAYFGPGSYYATQPTVGGFYQTGKTANSWHRFNDGTRDWTILNLEYAPPNGVMDWANQVLDAHPNDHAMIVTHVYMYTEDNRYDWATYGLGQSFNPHWPYLVNNPTEVINDGEEIWNKVVRKHNNVDFVFSGHALSPGVGYRSDLSDGGHVVHQMLANYQDKGGDGGDGDFRLLEFKPDGTVNVRTYSPWLDRYDTDYRQQFTLQMDVSHGPIVPPLPPLIPNAVAANLIVSGPTDPTSNAVGQIEVAQSSSLGFSVTNANRGDYELAIGGTGLQYYHGILLSSITQHERADFPGHRATVEAGRNSFGDGMLALSLMDAGNPNDNEVNYNVSVAWFQFQAGFRGAHVNANGSLTSGAYNGLVQSNVAHPAAGRYRVNLGVDSRTDGMLFVTGDNNDNVVVQTGPLSDGSGWDVRVASNASNFGSSQNRDWSFLYLPFSKPGLIGGYYDGANNTMLASAGNFTMNRLSTGQYELAVNGETPLTGMLILTIANLRTIGGVTSPDDAFLTYQPGVNGTFLINSYDLPGTTFEDTSFDWAFVRFNPKIAALPIPAGALAGDYNRDGFLDQADFSTWRSQFGMNAGTMSADGNRDGRVDGADFILWRKSISLAGYGQLLSGSQTVPEPAFLHLILMVAIFWCAQSRRHTDHPIW
jgi:hypothetical protein